MQIDRFLADLGGIPCSRDEQALRVKSADFSWFSPIMAAALAGRLADAVVFPRTEDDVIRIASTCARHRVPLVARGAGTGNFGQAVQLAGGAVVEMLGLDRLIFEKKNSWQVEVISQSPSDLGGYKEIIAKISGQGAYSRLKFESGGHRVQRVPVTETQGRIHTSACTVAVMPEADEVADVVLNPAELRVDTFRASGAGGQHVNKTDSAVRVTHLPSGIVVECQDDRSQHKNRARALAILAARIKDRQISEQRAKTAAARKSLIGSGDRSDRVQTYNFPQGRVTDHRINLTLYKIDRIMDGELDGLIEALTAELQAELLAQLAEEAA